MPSPSRGSRQLFLAWLALALLAGLAGLAASFAAGPATAPRVPWTTSKVTGSPEPPPPSKVVRAFTNLKFKQPLLMARPPKGNRLFVGEFAGVLYSLPDKP